MKRIFQALLWVTYPMIAYSLYIGKEGRLKYLLYGVVGIVTIFSTVEELF